MFKRIVYNKIECMKGKWLGNETNGKEERKNAIN